MKSFVILTLAATMAFAETSGTFTGIITDSMCGKDHSMMGSKKGEEDACVKSCVKSNPASFKYVLFDGKKTYKLSDQQLPQQFAAKKVVVKGTLYSKTGVIQVESIEAAQ